MPEAGSRDLALCHSGALIRAAGARVDAAFTRLRGIYDPDKVKAALDALFRLHDLTTEAGQDLILWRQEVVVMRAALPKVCGTCASFLRHAPGAPFGVCSTDKGGPRNGLSANAPDAACPAWLVAGGLREDQPCNTRQCTQLDRRGE